MTFSYILILFGSTFFILIIDYIIGKEVCVVLYIYIYIYIHIYIYVYMYMYIFDFITHFYNTFINIKLLLFHHLSRQMVINVFVLLDILSNNNN